MYCIDSKGYVFVEGENGFIPLAISVDDDAITTEMGTKSYKNIDVVSTVTTVFEVVCKLQISEDNPVEMYKPTTKKATK